MQASIIYLMEKLKQDAQALVGLHLTSRQLILLQRYEDELLSWNNRFNLTAIRESETIRTKHFLDSLSCILALRDSPPNRLIDIGTGAGFPGIPLKIAMPAMRLTLVESISKKAEFCQHVVKTLGLDGVDILTTRAEEIGQMAQHRQKYDWAVSRAVAAMPTLVEYLLPLIRIGGRILAQKGENAPAETQTAEYAIHLLGGCLHQLIPISLPGVVDERYLVVINKIAATPLTFPRRVGIPTKNPLVLPG
jgi:16S rRNA (guanine527-N7)-methyltransferase